MRDETGRRLLGPNEDPTDPAATPDRLPPRGRPATRWTTERRLDNGMTPYGDDASETVADEDAPGIAPGELWP